MPALPTRRNWLGLALVAGACALLAGCVAHSVSAAKEPITVFAAASLTEAFRDLSARFTEKAGIPVIANFSGSQQLRAQLRQGADADVFAAASEREMTAAVAEGLARNSDVMVFAHNRLVVALPAANPGRIRSFADLAQPGLRVVVADPAVPVGQYTQRMLDALAEEPGYGPEFRARVASNIVSLEQNVKAVVSKVQLGEADAGVVYATDVTPAVAEKVIALTVPAPFDQIATYPIASLAGAQHPAQAAQFVAFVLSDEGQAILASHGFMGAREE